MPVNTLFIGNDVDLSVSPFTDASTDEAIEDAELFATVCDAAETGLVQGATNAAPIVITSTGHGLITGDYVNVFGVGGNTAARGTWQITRIDDNTFSLDDSSGNAAWTRGGQWYRALDDDQARDIPLAYDGLQYLGILSGDIGLIDGKTYAVVFHAAGDYRDLYCQVDLAFARIRTGANN